MAGPLGCATHRYSIVDRDGNAVAQSGTLTEVEYNRVLNDTSTGSVTINVSDGDCCGEVGRIRSWRHMLNIFRGGKLMWTGFIVNIDWAIDSVKITGVDIIGLLDRRVPHQDFNFEDLDLTTIAETLIDDALAPDDPGHIVTVLGMAGVLGGRQYAEDTGQVGDHLRDLADTGIDFTALGTTVLIMPDNFCEVVGRLSDEDLPDGVTVAEDGASLATRQIVAGSESSEAIGSYGGVNDYYGLLEIYEAQSTISTQLAAEQAARARFLASAVAPVFIDTKNVTLAPTANIDIPSLVPGWCVDITSRATCRDISQRMKITGLQVTETGGSADSPGQEEITLQVTATGTNLEVM